MDVPFLWQMLPAFIIIIVRVHLIFHSIKVTGVYSCLRTCRTAGTHSHLLIVPTVQANKVNFRVSWRGAREPLLTAADPAAKAAKRAAGQWDRYRRHIAEHHCKWPKLIFCIDCVLLHGSLPKWQLVWVNESNMPFFVNFLSQLNWWPTCYPHWEGLNTVRLILFHAL